LIDLARRLRVCGSPFTASLPSSGPDLCTFRGLDSGILDIGLVFLSEPVRHITPARLAQPDTLNASALSKAR